MSDEMNTKQEKEDMSFLSRKKAAWNDFRRLPKAEKKRRVIDCLLNNALYMLIFVFPPEGASAFAPASVPLFYRQTVPQIKCFRDFHSDFG